MIYLYCNYDAGDNTYSYTNCYHPCDKMYSITNTLCVFFHTLFVCLFWRDYHYFIPFPQFALAIENLHLIEDRQEFWTYPTILSYNPYYHKMQYRLEPLRDNRRTMGIHTALSFS